MSHQSPRSSINPVIRLFVSSTFSDMKNERNALQEKVFPRLQRYCQRKGWRFQAIDLRWGISNEAAYDQSTMRICRAEIGRCQAVTPRPNFLVLLGDRYGWRPLPDEIPAAEFELMRPYLPAGLASRWYLLDENAVCPLPGSDELDKGLFILQPRTERFFDESVWFGEVEGPLGDAFRRAAKEVGLPSDARLKYEGSATAQEIFDGALAVTDAGNPHVRFDEGDGWAVPTLPATPFFRFLDLPGEPRASEVRFVVITDLHHGLAPDAQSRPRAFVEAAKRRESLDFVIQMGDFNYSLPSSKKCVDLLNTLPQPKIHVLGNHDMD